MNCRGAVDLRRASLWLATALGIGLLLGSRAWGQQVAPALQRWIDNDLIALRGAGAPSDYDYTHGTYLEYSWNRSSVALAQTIYTPRHNDVSPVSGDRPYAAFLFGEYDDGTERAGSQRLLSALALSVHQRLVSKRKTEFTGY